MVRSKFLFGLGSALAALALSAAPLSAQSLPGEGTTVKMAQPTWDTEWFQALIYKKAMEALGYEVEGPTTPEIGRALFRERMCKYEYISGGAVTLKKQKVTYGNQI